MLKSLTFIIIRCIIVLKKYEIQENEIHKKLIKIHILLIDICSCMMYNDIKENQREVI